MQVPDHLGLFQLRRPGIQQPGLGIVGVRHLEKGRFLHKVDLERMLVARGKGVALDLVIQGGRRARNVLELLALFTELRQA